MKLKQLEYLVKVMECGSITQAAQQMCVSQPSLTKAISNLEEEYGIQILIRKPRGVEFTQQGLDFVLYAKGVLAAVNTYPKAASIPLAKARLFLATHQFDFIYPALVEVYQKYCKENIFFNLVETDRSDVANQVLKGTVDFGFAIRTNVDSRNLLWNRESYRLDIQVVDSRYSYIAVSSKSCFWNRTSVKMEELSGQLHVAMDMEEQAKQSFWFEQGQYNEYNNNRIVFVNTTSACEYFLLNTDALTFCSYWTQGCFKSPDIQIIPVEDEMYRQELILIRRKGEPLTSVEADFTEAIYRKLGKTVPENIHCYATKNADVESL